MSEMSATGMNEEKGIYILEVKEDSDAFKFGFKPNDVILIFEMPIDEAGKSIKEINTINDFLFYYEERPWVKEFKVIINRNQTRKSLVIRK